MPSYQIGKAYKHLTVLRAYKNSSRQWIISCLCQCGKIHSVRKQEFRKHKCFALQPKLDKPRPKEHRVRWQEEERMAMERTKIIGEYLTKYRPCHTTKINYQIYQSQGANP